MIVEETSTNEPNEPLTSTDTSNDTETPHQKEERNIEVAEEMLKEGSLPLEKIARFSKLPLETVKQLSEKLLVVQA